MAEQPEALELLAWVKEAAVLEGGVVQDDIRTPAENAPTDAAGFASLAGHVLTIEFATPAAARAFLARAGATILELEEWSKIATVVQVGERRFDLREGIEKADDELKQPAA